MAHHPEILKHTKITLVSNRAERSPAGGDFINDMCSDFWLRKRPEDLVLTNANFTATELSRFDALIVSRSGGESVARSNDHRFKVIDLGRGRTLLLKPPSIHH